MKTQFSYVLQGRFFAPAGTKLNETETGVVLPDGSELKVWEVFEHHPAQPEPVNLTFDECAALGVHYDGDLTQLEQLADVDDDPAGEHAEERNRGGETS